MNFTDLEWALMLAVAVLLWRNSVLRNAVAQEERRANKYANWLMDVYKNKGKIVCKDDAYFFEESK